MCMSGPKAPDTSKQEAEAARQREEERQRHEQQLAETRRIAEEQRAREEARASEQRAQYEQTLRLQQDAMSRAEAQRAAQAAAAARAAEEERLRREEEARIRAENVQQYTDGRTSRIEDLRSSVNDAYSGFDDTYFTNFERDFVNYYNPRVENEFKDAQDQLTFRFTDQGGLQSSAAQGELRKLLEQRRAKEVEIANRARSSSQAFRGDIDTQRKNLLGEALSATNIGPEVLPEGVSDVGGRLEQLTATLSPYVTTAQQRAGSVAKPGFGNLSGFFSTQGSPGSQATTSASGSDLQFYDTGLFQPRTGQAARVVN